MSHVEEDVVAKGYQIASTTPLGKGEPAQKARRVDLPVPDPVKDGRYTFYCTISKFSSSGWLVQG